MKVRLLVLMVLWSFACAITKAQTYSYTYTGITGFYDYQTSYRTPQHVRACPGSSMIHATLMVADDSLAPSTSRRTAYAFSSNGGSTWTTFNQIRLPDRRSGFASLDIGQGANSCVPIVANHNTVGTALQSAIFLDAPPGTGAFAEIDPPFGFGGTDEPVFAEVAGTADGGVVLVASRLTTGTTHVTRTTDFTSWGPWADLAQLVVSDGYVAEGNNTGRVGIAITRPETSLLWFESTNNGATWPASPTQLLPDHFPVGPDSFAIIQGLDLAYPARDTLIAFGTAKIVDQLPSQRYAGIGFWSESTGFVLAVPHDSIPGVAHALNKRQSNHNTVGYPAIGLSGSTIVIAFQAFRPETSLAGFNYSEIFYTFSTNRGISWSRPRNITNTANLDERYPSISKWNSPGEAYIVYQEDPQPGSAVFGGDNSPMARVRQRFCRISGLPTGIDEAAGEVPNEFALSQNYPNPFNPVTNFQFSIVNRQWTILKVYDLLGREVATLVNEVKQPGTYMVQWDAAGLASGVYFYRLQMGNFVDVKKLVLLR